MATKGRKRMSLEELNKRIQDYNERFGIAGDGFPGHPGKLCEKSKLNAWNSLYKAKNRIERRERGQCERCNRPVSEGSTQCIEHRSKNSGTSGSHRAKYADRERLYEAQGGVCPLCMEMVQMWDDIDHNHTTGELRGLVHHNCNMLVAYIEASGREPTLRALRYLGLLKI